MSAAEGRGREGLIGLFGAPTDTGNLGVSALGESTIAAVAHHRPGVDLLVFDNGRGRRATALDGFDYTLDGAWISRRLHRSESLWSMVAASRVHGLPNRNVRSLRRAEQVLDISGGDSFTDLYGAKRWNLVALPKLLSLRLGRPLVLLPQTYGPYNDPERRRAASDIVARSSSAWARDGDGLDDLRELLGRRFDPRRHRQGVDVAFALPSREPELPSEIATWLQPGSAREGVIGLNVSGLLMNDPDPAAEQFGLTVDYPAVIRQLARRLLDTVAERLVLVPHVRGVADESDDPACAGLAAFLDEPDRVAVLPNELDAAETKWCIQQMHWFCGTRMHSTIAALSTGVPASAIAYSHKTKGVFATADMEDAVADARTMSADDVVHLLLERAGNADRDRPVLVERARELRRQARDQFTEILAVQPPRSES